MKLIIFIVVFFLLHPFCGCSQKQKPESAKGNLDSLYATFKKITYESYRSKTIGELLRNDTLKSYKKLHFIHNLSCLSYIEVVYGNGIFVNIYPSKALKFTKNCDSHLNWDINNLKKEEFYKIEVERCCPDLEKTIVFKP